MYIYVGSLTCSGKLDNGKPWSGLRLAAGVFLPGSSEPYAVKVYKVSNDDEVQDTIADMEYGERFSMSFDEKGRVVHVRPI